MRCFAGFAPMPFILLDMVRIISWIAICGGFAIDFSMVRMLGYGAHDALASYVYDNVLEVFWYGTKCVLQAL